MPNNNVSFTKLIQAVQNHANNYEQALLDLESSASSSAGSGKS